MHRRIPKIIAIASAVIAIAFATWWIRSLWIADFVGRFNGRGGCTSIISSHATIAFYYHSSGWGSLDFSYLSQDNADQWRNGYDWFAFHPQPEYGGFCLLFPHAVLCAIFASPTIVFIVRSRRRAGRGFPVEVAQKPDDAR